MREENFLNYKKGDGTPSGNPDSISIGSQEKFSTLGQAAGQQGEPPAATSLLKQCVTRLRGIVEALDNIHDTNPHRWSTDLDEVHSSAESLLALIKDQAPPSEDQLIAAGLSYPLPKEDAVKLWYSGFRSEVITVLEAWEAIGHDTGIHPDKEELLESLRNMAAICNAHGNDLPAQSAIDQRQVIADAITGALAFGAQASQAPAADHWLRPFYDIGRAEGQRTQDLAMLVRMLASSLKRHAPDSNLVVRATNYLAAKGLAGTPLRDAPASVEQAGGDERDLQGAQAERPDVVGYRSGTSGGIYADGYGLEKPEPLMTVAQHERITAQLHDALDECDGDRWKLRSERDAAQAMVAELEKADIAATLRREFPLLDDEGLDENEHHCEWSIQQERKRLHALLAAPVAQAQHSVPEGYALIPVRETEAMHDAVMALLYKGVARTDTQKLLDAYIAGAPGKEVPQAWLDVQAERRRQVTAEGWTPEHDDAHSHGEMALAAASYAAYAHVELSGDLPMFWPWGRTWWKPTTPRRDLVKACALGLAEIERLDRVAASQGGPSDA
ncbi:hypothetical protein [Pseudomonas aeruginosa]|uniref:hypothetical protein n=1 Tax=Pseudomonas aeruginosa TaxID=287 RepID=UPI000ABE9468|nr:hypothetical protein [Pseudomonas aeruginosa]MBG6487126.1 hypothetical protein [Pseudomonas aeruginosa]MCS7748589.1 hypothetical protein [Pseudomonas aeruginosa]MCS9648799.1 hypothetical protein [Pseudomonas aeruginosa]MDV7884814.1 hypothetical protein [Pseudomonas aeruginosa]WBJ82718.1 hypothetical protein PALA54_02560 [Pseudomonas aeruginosa]